ncbi:MAG: GGDEF domain-containing protein [Campylobacterota bacterium]|nr:GGDEF domain-containing protein [Campylobacterota bacterium]
MIVSKKLLSISTIIIVVIVTLFMISYYSESRIITLKEQHYKQESRHLKDNLINLIEAKKKATTAIAISLSSNTLLQEVLSDQNSSIDLKDLLQRVSLQLRNDTDYDHVWIQLINKRGISKARSWVDKHGDSLIDARNDIKEMIARPTTMNIISTGKFSMTFKSMVPIFNKKKEFLGSIETITHFNSIIHELQKSNIASLVVVDKRYQKQLSKAITKDFIDGYYVVNFHLDKTIRNLANQKGIKMLINIQNYTIEKDYFITTHSLKDLYGKDMGYYILIKNLDDFEYKSINNFLESMRMIILIGLLLTLFILLVFYKRKHDIDQQRQYFKAIIDSTTDMIIITDTHHPIDVNQAFFEFFDEFTTLQAFEKVYGCVCNLFEKEEGFLQKWMGEYSWVEYVYHHPEIDHKVKIVHRKHEHIFSVNIKALGDLHHQTYTLVLTDITKMTRYHEELKYLSQRDALTSIGNREFFNQNITQEIADAKRYNTAISLIMFDIDYFKLINDTYGHDVGDIVLIELAQSIQKLLRASDIFCRYGGEEFMIIVPKATMHEASILAERIRVHTQDLDIHPVEQTTISIGVTQFTNYDSIDTLIKRVDTALYQSKEGGRNRITVI